MLPEGEGDAVREVGEAAGGEGVADVPHLFDHPHHVLQAIFKSEINSEIKYVVRAKPRAKPSAKPDTAHDE